MDTSATLAQATYFDLDIPLDHRSQGSLLELRSIELASCNPVPLKCGLRSPSSSTAVIAALVQNRNPEVNKISANSVPTGISEPLELGNGFGSEIRVAIAGGGAG